MRYPPGAAVWPARFCPRGSRQAAAHSDNWMECGNLQMTTHRVSAVPCAFLESYRCVFRGVKWYSRLYFRFVREAVVSASTYLLGD